VAVLARIVRDVGVAEELAQDALLAALEQWPKSGAPENAGAWLMAAAKNRAINHLRHERLVADKHVELGHLLEPDGEAALELERAAEDDIGDDLLRLVFTACHPALSTEGRVALTLRLVCGLTTAEIARAFLVSEPTIAQRIVRAKRTLAEARIPFEVPAGSDRAPRLASVLGVVYLVFNEGYTATAGDDLVRPELSTEALRLGGLLTALAPTEPEVFGLLALMELTAARAAARVDEDGEPVRLLDQDRARWDQEAIARGLGALARAEELGGAPGSFVLQARIAACHARARVAADTDWAEIAALYAVLAERTRSPVVELNRAVAVAMAEGAAAGLALVDRLSHEPALENYHLLPSARAELLEKLGRLSEAADEFRRAASLTKNERQRTRLLARADACGQNA
jgi:RNA polymerase sigma factor (sigma-70 family)